MFTAPASLAFPMGITPLGASLPLCHPGRGHLGPALPLSTSTEPVWSHCLLEGEYKSFKVANVFFFSFPILGEENGYFFFATFFTVTGMKK